MKTTQTLLYGIRDTLSWNVIKVALITGVPLALIWIVIGYILWNPAMSFTAIFIGWIPFSILKANGAFLIGGFVWFAAVLITYALIIAFGNMLIFRHVSEQKYSLFSILLLLLIALGWTLFAFLNWDFVYGEVARVLTWFPFETLEKGVAAMLAALIFYNLFIVTLAIVVLIMRKSFLHKLQERDYPIAKMIEKEERVKFLPIALRDAVIFFVLLALFFPLLFVPFFNIMVQVLLWAWLIKESYFLGAASLYATESEILELRKHQFVLWGIAATASVLNLIPVVNIFAPFFALIMYFHWMMLNKESA
jgi:hypothetical protein